MAYSVIVWLVDPGKHPQQDQEEEWAQAGRDETPGRAHSSFVFDPGWSNRPWPPRDKYEHAATDEELGLT